VFHVISGVIEILDLASAVRFVDWIDCRPNPSDKSLGYFHVIRSRGRNVRYFLGKACFSSFARASCHCL